MSVLLLPLLKEFLIRFLKETNEARKYQKAHIYVYIHLGAGPGLDPLGLFKAHYGN